MLKSCFFMQFYACFIKLACTMGRQSAPGTEARQEGIDMDLRLKGRTVLVTGASQGIGEGVARYPLKRPDVHEITDLIVFLASYRSGYTSGTIFTVDGGIASRRSVI